jgi:hypothetical protein
MRLALWDMNFLPSLIEAHQRGLIIDRPTKTNNPGV